MTKAAAIRILIVDDHPVVREGIAAMISRRNDLEVAGKAESGEEGVELYRRLRPDVVLMDLRMPGMSGVAAIRTIREEFADAHIVVLTTYDGDEDIHRAVQAGALAYLLKDAPLDELLAAIRAVHAGQQHLTPQVAAALAEHEAGSELTDREQEVLELIVGGKSNKQIGKTLAITEGTVKVHVNKILGKLEVEDRTQAATAALRRGLVSPSYNQR